MKKVLYSNNQERKHVMQNLHKYLISIIVVTMINGYVSVHFMKENKKIYHEYYKDLYAENVELHQQLEEFYSYGIKVDVTMYQPVWPQSDRTPHITADGTTFNINKASRYRYVALSRNLLSRWGGPFDYGDFVLIKGALEKDGVYQVRDTMNAKWVNVVDILESKGVRQYRFNNVDLFKLPWIKKEKENA